MVLAVQDQNTRQWLAPKGITLTVTLSEDAQLKLGRLCDYYHPREVGGYLLGSQELDFVVSDIAPAVNYSQTPQNSFQFSDHAHHYADVMAASAGKSIVGKFHSHPNGSIPSEQDLKACGSGLWIWVCHKAQGEHSFFAAENINHVDLIIQANPHESRAAYMQSGRLNLGDIWISQWGKIETIPKITRLLQLDEKARRAYLTFLALPKEFYNKSVSVQAIATAMNVSRRVARDWLKQCVTAKLLAPSWGRRWTSVKEWT